MDSGEGAAGQAGQTGGAPRGAVRLLWLGALGIGGAALLTLVPAALWPESLRPSGAVVLTTLLAGQTLLMCGVLALVYASERRQRRLEARLARQPHPDRELG